MSVVASAGHHKSFGIERSRIQDAGAGIEQIARLNILRGTGPLDQDFPDACFEIHRLDGGILVIVGALCGSHREKHGFAIRQKVGPAMGAFLRRAIGNRDLINRSARLRYPHQASNRVRR